MAATSFIRNLWYVAAWSHELEGEGPIGRVMLGEPIVLWRKTDGTVIAMEDRCPHRFALLSLGRIEGDDLRCMYHGLKLNCQGLCKEMPPGNPAPPIRESRYFFATGVEAEHAKPSLLEGMFKIVNAAFLEEQRILEGQQRILDLTPEGARMFATPHDAAVLAFRRLVQERLQVEAR